MPLQIDLDFLSRVVAWPVGALSTGYVNLHWRSPDKKKLIETTHEGGFFLGKPTKTVAEFAKLMNWCLAKPDIKDMYFCTSLQSAAMVTKKGAPKAVKLAENAMALKAIWLDLDVAKGGIARSDKKEYLNWDEVFADLQKFVTKFGLPWPNAIVCSGYELLPDGKHGGGIQAYWISDCALTRAEWTPYAEGLKAAAIQFGLLCDTVCTADAARILRLPGTFNYKKDPPRPASVVSLDATDFDFAKSLQVLQTIAPVTATVTAAHSNLFDPTLFPKRNAVVESLAEGLEREEIKVSITSVAKACPFVMDSLMTGGANNAQPLWMLTTLMSTFMEDGEKVAHAMSDGHAGYTQESTDELWQRKLADKAKSGLGYPSCKTIQGWGAKQCIGCPNLAKGKSPLNFGTPTQPAAPPQAVQPVASVGNSGQVPPVLPTGLFGAGGPTPPPSTPAASLMLPDGYCVNKTGHICYLIPGKGTEPDQEIQLFKRILSRPWVQGGLPSQSAINFTSTFDLGNDGPVSVPTAALATENDTVRSLYAQLVLTEASNKEVKDFLVSWHQKIDDAQKAIASRPFGWLYNAVAVGQKQAQIPDGFVFGGKAFHSDGTIHDSGHGDSVLRDLYMPKGDKQSWLDAAKLITDQKRPELDAIIAASFGAPLMMVPGEYNSIISCWGDGGSGKTSAMKVGSAVWGHPKMTKLTTDATAKSVRGTMGETKNLPLFWDEIRGVDALKAVYRVLFSGDGTTHSANNKDGTQRKREEFQLLTMLCANTSYIDYLVKEHKESGPAIRRLFEYQITSEPNPAGIIQVNKATNIFNNLERNYGAAGLEYAQFLGQNPAKVWAITEKFCNDLVAELEIPKEERYWMSAVTALEAGAYFANMFGADIDLPAFHKWLKKAYIANRDRLNEEAVEISTGEKAQDQLTAFLNEHVGNQVFTDTAPVAGKPVGVRLIKGPPRDRGMAIYVQWATVDRKLRILRKPFIDWLTKDVSVSIRPIMQGLMNRYKMTYEYKSLASGTPYVVGQSKIISIDVVPGSELEELMNAFEARQDTGAPHVTAGTVVPQSVLDQAAADLATAARHVAGSTAGTR